MDAEQSRQRNCLITLEKWLFYVAGLKAISYFLTYLNITFTKANFTKPLMHS